MGLFEKHLDDIFVSVLLRTLVFPRAINQAYHTYIIVILLC